MGLGPIQAKPTWRLPLDDDRDAQAVADGKFAPGTVEPRKRSTVNVSVFPNAGRNSAEASSLHGRGSLFVSRKRNSTSRQVKFARKDFSNSLARGADAGARDREGVVAAAGVADLLGEHRAGPGFDRGSDLRRRRGRTPRRRSVSFRTREAAGGRFAQIGDARQPFSRDGGAGGTSGSVESEIGVEQQRGRRRAGRTPGRRRAGSARPSPARSRAAARSARPW